ncbi:hypothetical protein O181_000847 [Austropuccinia psidii MF-1]|uniref:DUF7872 domain-containing protein n=1 Tax=Austropuccinia psidii MF-1 TaxID=1389203 RepID=A0A9Q3B9P0_9BASI|nr:hypothetical protein [Austropuccinia psidii MF-1]
MLRTFHYFILLTTISFFPEAAGEKILPQNYENNQTALAIARKDCSKQPLTRELWKRLDLNEYMSDYPGGKTLNLQAYADGLNVTNFICGIGQPCNAGQLCSSAMAPGWYILVASQNWNLLLNMIYTSVGFGTPAGMYGVLKDGVFLQQSMEKTQFNLQSKFSQVIKLKLLAAILRAQNVFITRGSDPCKHGGTNGAFSGKNVLSYCGKDKVMMNIVKAKGSKTHMKIFGASTIEGKYGFSTEFLTESAWKCQTKYGKYQYDPYEKSPLPSDINADCLFNLPVCDCTRKDIEKRRADGIRTVTACLQGGVPIYNTGEKIG